MADTPSDGTPDTAPTPKPTPRRRTRNATGTSGSTTAAPAAKKRRSSTKRAATEDAGPPPAKRGRPKSSAGNTPGTKAAEVKPKVARAARTVRKKTTATADAAAKPKNRTRLIAGAAAAVVGVAGAIAATVGRKKIAKVSGDVMEAVNDKLEAVGATEPARVDPPKVTPSAD